MMKFFGLFLLYLGAVFSVPFITGYDGVLGQSVSNSPFIFLGIYAFLISHITITCMSLSFHRQHTHQGIKINKFLDYLMQTWLWLVTNMSKSEWVSVHIYHHAHSDKPKDPHSPIQKGFWRIFFGGAYDYSVASKNPEVLKLRKHIKESPLERFFDQNKLLGPIILSGVSLLVFGPLWGTIISFINMTVSPILAVGGVNALAHYIGYRNHHSGDNSRNIGFLFPLNFIICGELDHNNHHKYPKSCSFRHKWYEFDIGYVYIKILEKLSLVEVKNVYNTKRFKEELGEQVQKILEHDFRFQKRCQDLARELDMNWEELKNKIVAYVEGHRPELSDSTKNFIKELKRAAQINLRLNLRFA